MKEEKCSVHLVMIWASEPSVPLSSVANRDPLYQSRTNRLGQIKYLARATLPSYVMMMLLHGLVHHLGARFGDIAVADELADVLVEYLMCSLKLRLNDARV